MKWIKAVRVGFCKSDMKSLTKIKMNLKAISVLLKLSRETRWELTAHATAAVDTAVDTWAWPGATVAKPPHHV